MSGVVWWAVGRGESDDGGESVDENEGESEGVDGNGDAD